MAAFLFIVKIIGIVLLCILGLLLLSVLLLLFAPIRYEAHGRIDDPEGRDAFDAGALQAESCADFHFSWLHGFLRGGIRWPQERVFTLKIAWVSVDAAELFKKLIPSKKEPEKETQKKPRKKRPRGSIGEGLRRFSAAWKKLDEAEGGRSAALGRIAAGAADILRPVLPSHWEVRGVIGPGDVEKAARLMEAEGLLLPLVGSHVWITPQFEGYRFDLEAEAEGSVRLISILTAAVRFALLPDLRLLRPDGK